MEGNNDKNGNNGPYKYSAKGAKNVEKGMTPESNSEYFDNGFKYRTDSSGRTILEEGWLKPESAERNLNAQRKIGGKGFDAGHGIKSSSGGSGEAVNLTKMRTDLNRYGKAKFGELSEEQKESINKGEGTEHFNIENYRDMERYIDHEIASGKDVYFQKNNHYDGNSDAPSHYDINLIVKDKDGTTHNHSFSFQNVDKAERAEQRGAASEANRDEVKSQEAEMKAKSEEWKEYFKQQGYEIENDEFENNDESRLNENVISEMNESPDLGSEGQGTDNTSEANEDQDLGNKEQNADTSETKEGQDLGGSSKDSEDARESSSSASKNEAETSTSQDSSNNQSM